MTTQLSPVPRSGASSPSQEEDEFAGHEENPLEFLSSSILQATPSIRSDASIQATPNVMVGPDPFSTLDSADNPDEPPPPYEELATTDAPDFSCVEYGPENSPQLVVSPPLDWARGESARSGELETLANSSVQSPGSPVDPTLIPRPLQLRPSSPRGSLPQDPVRTQSTGTTFSSAKAREAGFEIEQVAPRRTISNSSIVIVPSTEALKHTREAGKLTAYLVPLPKPRLRGIKPEDIPNRFMIYTPPLPPLSKPAPGEKESPWHKTQRTWQEDVRKARFSNASKATWRGMKAKTSHLLGKGVNLTRSTNMEFLDRVSGGAITSATEDAEWPDVNDAASTIPSLTSTSTASVPDSDPTATCPKRASTTSLDKGSKPKDLEQLTLIFPPSLDLTPEQIRAEFVESLLRTRDKARKDAIVASSLIPFAATVDVVMTLGSLTSASSVWAYQSIKGSITSKKVTDGLLITAEAEGADITEEPETIGCTCGHHENDFGAATQVPKDKGKGKKKEGINLHMQQNSHIEIFKRYLSIACLNKEYLLFPQVEEMVGDVDEEAILQAIGWLPTRRQGRDLELEFKDRTENLTPEQDEEWQRHEAKEDIKRLCEKAAKEWVAWCKNFSKGFGKDPEAAAKK